MLYRSLLTAGLLAIAALVLAPEHASAQVDTTKEVYPDIGEFVDVSEEARYDPEELQRNIHYPPDARKAGIEGTVIVRVLISKTGGLVRMLIDRSDNKLLEQAAVDAIRNITFTPGRTPQGPVAMWSQIEVNFRLTK